MDKKKLEKIIKCVAAVAALFMFVVAVVWTMDYDKGTDDTYDVVFMGDSNLGNTRNETGIVPLLEKKTGKKILNGSFGGSMMKSLYGKKTEYQSSLSMYNMAVSICNRNFGMQKSAIDTLARTDYIGYFSETMDKLSEVDFDTVEILIIEHGVNDFLAGTPIKNDEDLYDINTFSGTLRTIVVMLREEYPDLRLILVTPSYCAPLRIDGLNYPCDKYAYGGGYLEEYVNAELEVAQELDVEIIDVYHGIDMDETNFSTYLYDGLHYNEAGREAVADMIADYLLGEAK